MIMKGTIMEDKSRLRTAYDRLVMAGLAPYVPGGNPTAEEAKLESYCITYGHSPVAGMMHVHSEDLDHVAATRARRNLPPVECEQCDMVYTVDRWVQAGKP